MIKHMLIASSAFLLIAGCTSMPMGAGRTASSIDMNGTDLLAQTQLPPGARILHEQSTVIGSGNNWVGRVVIDSAREPAAAFSYFLENYPAQGWTLLSAVRAKTSVLVFTKQEHNVTIEIQEGNLMTAGAAIAILTRAPLNANDLTPAAAKYDLPKVVDIPSKP